MIVSLHLTTTLAIGLFAGALLTEGSILVPYWRKMPPSEFFRLHGEMGPSLFRYFAPLTTIAVSLSVLSALVATWQRDANIWHMAASGLCLAALLVFFTYFRKANGKFADHSISEKDLGAELARWASWHWLRTFAVLMAFVCSLAALSA